MSTISERSYNSVFIGNIAFDATEESLKDLFCQVGPVVGIRMVFDRETGKPKGYGFCEYADKETALSAQRNLNGVEFFGRHLRVDAAVGERSKEEMQRMRYRFRAYFTNELNLELRMAFSEKPEEEPKDQEQDPLKIPREIAKAVVQLSPEQMFELMRQMKLNRNEARNMLLKQPHLTFALLQVLLCTKKLNFNQAMALLSTQPTVDKQQEPNYSKASHREPLLTVSSQPLVTANIPMPNIYVQRGEPMNLAMPGPSSDFTGTRMAPQPVRTNANPTVLEAEKNALIKQVMSLTQEQIEALPAEHRQTIINLRQQFQNAPAFNMA